MGRLMTATLAGFVLALWITGAHAAFVDNGNGTVTDTSTGLIWQQDTARDGQGNYDTMTWEEALSYCESRTLGGHTDWRLPTIKELRSLVDYSRYKPAINTTFFPNTVSSYYWSSTTSAHDTDGTWGVDFDDGCHDWRDKSDSNHARAVRGGQSGSFDHFVEPLGICGGRMPCYTTIQAAIDAADDGDTLLVGQGHYYETIVLDEAKSLKLLCGRADDFGPGTMFSTAYDLEIRRGSVIVERLHLVGE